MAGHRGLRPAGAGAGQPGRAGLGYLLAALVVLGGLVFNIGNIAGTALGINAMFGLDVRIGGAISAAVAIAIFLSSRAGRGDGPDRRRARRGDDRDGARTSRSLSARRVGEALRQTVLPETIDFLVITTLIGGTVGGYITYAGAHRLVDSGSPGTEHVREITRARSPASWSPA